MARLYRSRKNACKNFFLHCKNVRRGGTSDRRRDSSERASERRKSLIRGRMAVSERPEAISEIAEPCSDTRKPISLAPEGISATLQAHRGSAGAGSERPEPITAALQSPSRNHYKAISARLQTILGSAGAVLQKERRTLGNFGTYLGAVTKMSVKNAGATSAATQRGGKRH